MITYENSEKYRDQIFNANLRSKYGISLKERTRLFEEQNGCCKVCKRHESEFKRRLHIDHDHATGKIRGLLCANCNLVLGGAKDNSDNLLAGAAYLKNAQD